MDVDLPSTGCNILTGATTFSNYNTNNTIRDNYIIYDGKAYLQSSTYNQYGYSYSGTCLSTGDLVYKPEYKEFIFPLISLVAFLFILCLVYKIFVKRLMP